MLGFPICCEARGFLLRAAGGRMENAPSRDCIPRAYTFTKKGHTRNESLR